MPRRRMSSAERLDVDRKAQLSAARRGEVAREARVPADSEAHQVRLDRVRHSRARRGGVVRRHADARAAAIGVGRRDAPGSEVRRVRGVEPNRDGPIAVPERRRVPDAEVVRAAQRECVAEPAGGGVADVGGVRLLEVEVPIAVIPPRVRPLLELLEGREPLTPRTGAGVRGAARRAAQTRAWPPPGQRSQRMDRRRFFIFQILV